MSLTNYRFDHFEHFLPVLYLWLILTTLMLMTIITLSWKFVRYNLTIWCGFYKVWIFWRSWIQMIHFGELYPFCNLKIIQTILNFWWLRQIFVILTYIDHFLYCPLLFAYNDFDPFWVYCDFILFYILGDQNGLWLISTFCWF